MKFRKLLAVLGLMACFSASATEYVPCDGCDYSAMSNAALARGVGRYVVGNVLQGEVYGFRVYVASRPKLTGTSQPLATQRRFVDETTLAPAENEAFKALASFYQQAPVGYQKHYNLTIVPSDQPATFPANSTATSDRTIASTFGSNPIPQSLIALGVQAPGSGGTVHYDVPGTNVYSVINSGPAQNQLLTWVGNRVTYQITTELTSLTKAADVFHLTNASVLPTVSFTITFEDGSKIGVYADTTQSPAQLKINPNSGVDSHGNNVPASRDAAAGLGIQNYDFSGSGGSRSDLANMQNQLRGLGILAPTTTTFACTRVAGGEIHCVPTTSRGF